MSELFRNLIAGEWVGADTWTDNISPSDTRDVIGRYAMGSRADVQEAVAAARTAAFGWSRTTPAVRHGILRAASDELMARRQEIGRVLAREEGKTLAEAVGEVVRASQVFEFFAGECLRIAGETLDSIRPGARIDVTREPVGVVGIITPWNFPIAIPAWKIAPALAYGNAVVFKPAELVPGSAWLLVDILKRAGLPDGVLNLVMGHGSEVGEALLNHSGVNAISFTGSVPTGRRVAAACAAHMRKAQLEMGGKNPLVVLNDADLDTAVECTVNGAFFSTGQRCTATSRLIVEDAIHDRFVEALAERMRKLVVGDALAEGTQIGPVVSEPQLTQDVDYIRLGRDEGASLVVGGEMLKLEKPGFYFQPALFTGADNSMRICREEIFGPVASVIRVGSYDEALEIANDTEFGLSAGICTNSLKHSSHFKRNAEAGMVMVNLPTAGVDYHAPFGGRKGSSLGSREQGRYAVEFYTTVKTAYTQP